MPTITKEPSRRHRRCARQEHGRATAKGAASSPAPTVPEPLPPTSPARSSTRPARAALGRSPPVREHTAPCAALAARQSTRQPVQTATRSPSPTPGEGSSTSTTSRQRSRCAGRRQRDLGRGAATCSVSRSHVPTTWPGHANEDRKSTRLNSSHVSISYAVFCLKKKKKYNTA